MESFVDPAVEEFAYVHPKPESDLYRRLREETHRVMEQPQMQVGLMEGRFLKTLVRLMKARAVLEIGMFTGYSTLMMAEGLPENGRVITCEINPKRGGIDRRFLAEGPDGNKIDDRMGPEVETIKMLSGPLDLVFIDADKENYSNY